MEEEKGRGERGAGCRTSEGIEIRASDWTWAGFGEAY